MSDQFFWFATRGAGIMSWFAASLSLLVGLMMSSRVLGRRPTLPWLLDVHRFFAAMSMVFLAIHMLTLWADSFVSFSWGELFVPGVAAVPGLSGFYLALGVLSGWMLAVVELSSLIKNYLPPRVWHTLHLGSFGVVIGGLFHAVEVGSDADNRFLVAAATSVLAAIVLVGLIRGSRFLSDRKYRYDVELEAGSDDDRFHDDRFHGDRLAHDDHLRYDRYDRSTDGVYR